MKDFTPTDWTDERLARARELKQQGLSAAKIAAAIGGGATRNSVIGKFARLDAKAAPKGPAPKLVMKKAPSAPLLVVEAPVVEAPTTFVCLRVSIADIKPPHCRWPIGDPRDPDFAYCGRERDGDKPYCAHHCAIAYLPVLTRAERAAMAR